MDNDNISGISNLISKEVNSQDKILKPDFTQKTGRELLAFYLQTKFKQILAYDKSTSNPIFTKVNPDFIKKFSRRLIDNPKKHILIGITGESASGKSTICKEIQHVIKKLSLPVSILTTDNYFKDISKLIEEYEGFDNLRDAGYEIDSPKNFQLDILREDLEKLSMGEDIFSPEYLPNGTGISVPKSVSVLSQKVIVVEGLATLYEGIKDLIDITVYIETDLDTRHDRFISRACQERNQDLENALKHWDYIIEEGKKYILPSRENVDLIIDGNVDLRYFSGILKYIHTVTNNFETDEKI